MPMHASPQHFFSKNPAISINRSSFNRTHNHKTTLNTDYLIPMFCDEVLPGDTFNLHHSIYTRLISALDVPMMDNMHIDTFYFFVPSRLVWTNFKAFMGEKRRPSDTTSYTIPQINITTAITPNTIYDYLGIPLGVTGFSINALPLRAYNLIYNEWFRSEQLIDYITENLGDGPDLQSDYQLQRRGKRFDYYTSCLVEPQTGSPVSLPLGISAPVIGNGVALGLTDGSQDFGLYNYNTSTGSDRLAYGSATGTYHGSPSYVTGSLKAFGVTSDGTKSGMIADLQNATAVPITTLAQAFQMQAFNTITARSGNRYTEILYSHFSVISPDSRLQRPEYLGGSHDRLQMSIVPQTSGTTSTSPQGNLSAYMYGGSSKHGFTKSFTEHGYIIGLINIYADLTYQQGLNRMWSRQTKFDFYWPEFANLYDQTVLNKEIFTQGTSADDDVFGYQERYAEYKYFPNMITGSLRSTAPNTLDIWHLAQKFDNLPTLSKDFIEEHVPIQRIVSVTDEVQFVCDMNFYLNCVRPMPVYNDPMKWFMRA